MGPKMELIPELWMIMCLFNTVTVFIEFHVCIFSSSGWVPSISDSGKAD